ncbi:GFA family protein [Bowmanella denitrificans]|uniref:GFA family protein n=1 Tax=Bowmanella denitrificans TaxID=366582 RepID=UPI000C9C9A8F|nr:GFA family protein [Bowmanella denitrificans]
MSQKYQGSCLCGNVRFSVDGFSDKAANCHCSMCRKFHGAAFGTLVGVQGLAWLSGKDLLKDFVASNGTIRTFCINCGSSIGFRVKGEPVGNIELAIATFDTDIPVTIDAQIYTGYKANWCELQPELPAYFEGRTGAC